MSCLALRLVPREHIVNADLSRTVQIEPISPRCHQFRHRRSSGPRRTWLIRLGQALVLDVELLPGGFLDPEASDAGPRLLKDLDSYFFEMTPSFYFLSFFFPTWREICTHSLLNASKSNESSFVLLIEEVSLQTCAACPCPHLDEKAAFEGPCNQLLQEQRIPLAAGGLSSFLVLKSFVIFF